jgi:peptidyl-tRNA hydrolase
MGHNENHHNGQNGHNGLDQTVPELAFQDKARKLLEHWIKHNNDHEVSYRQWAGEFHKNELTAAATLLETAADLTMQINLAMQQALTQLE